MKPTFAGYNRLAARRLQKSKKRRATRSRRMFSKALTRMLSTPRKSWFSLEKP